MFSRPLFYIKIFLVVAFFAILGFYFFHQSRAYFLGPTILIESPKQGAVLANSFVKIKGKAVNASSVSLDGWPLLLNSSGNFEEGLLLARGYNIIEISAKDRFGRQREKKLELVYQP